MHTPTCNNLEFLPARDVTIGHDSRFTTSDDTAATVPPSTFLLCLNKIPRDMPTQSRNKRGIIAKVGCLEETHLKRRWFCRTRLHVKWLRRHFLFRKKIHRLVFIYVSPVTLETFQKKYTSMIKKSSI